LKEVVCKSFNYVVCWVIVSLLIENILLGLLVCSLTIKICFIGDCYGQRIEGRYMLYFVSINRHICLGNISLFGRL